MQKRYIVHYKLICILAYTILTPLHGSDSTPKLISNSTEEDSDVAHLFVDDFVDDYNPDEHYNILQWAIAHKRTSVVTSIINNEGMQELLQSKNNDGVSALDMLVDPQHIEMLDHVAQNAEYPEMLRDANRNPLYTLALKNNNEGAISVLSAADITRPRGNRFLDQANSNGIPEIVTAYLLGSGLTQQALGFWAMTSTADNDDVIRTANYMLAHDKRNTSDIQPLSRSYPTTYSDVVHYLFSGYNPFLTAVLISYLPIEKRLQAENNIFYNSEAISGILKFIRDRSARNEAVIEDLMEVFSVQHIHSKIFPHLIHNAYYEIPYFNTS